MLAPVVRGGAAGVRALLKQAQGSRLKGSLAKAAERFLRRQTELEDTSLFEHAPAARAEHAARLDEAQVALRKGRPARMADAPRAAMLDLHVGQDGAFGRDWLSVILLFVFHVVRLRFPIKFLVVDEGWLSERTGFAATECPLTAITVLSLNITMDVRPPT